MATIDVPEDSIVAKLSIKAGELEEGEVNRFLAAFAQAAVTCGLEQATVATEAAFLGVAW